MNHIFFVLLILISGCSLRKAALRSASPVFDDSSKFLTQEKNWDFFKESTPGNLKFMELLYLQDRENRGLLKLLVKGYAGYAYGVHETEAFGDDLNGRDDSSAKRAALDHYTRALDYGLNYFEQKGISRQDLIRSDENTLSKLFEKKLNEDDFLAVIYTAQAWGSLINLQKDNIALVSHVPKVRMMFDFVCKTKPDIELGVCPIFYAQYEASRPRMLGGNPEKGEKLFQEATFKNPKHLLMRLAYIQYSILPALDGEKYEKEAKVLREEFKKWKDLNRDTLENTSEYKDVPELNLFNAIAEKRFQYIEKLKAKLF